jgi:hypothetical protein
MNKEETHSPSEWVSHFKDISFNEFLVELFIITPGENGTTRISSIAKYGFILFIIYFIDVL